MNVSGYHCFLWTIRDSWRRKWITAELSLFRGNQYLYRSWLHGTLPVTATWIWSTRPTAALSITHAGNQSPNCSSSRNLGFLAFRFSIPLLWDQAEKVPQDRISRRRSRKLHLVKAIDLVMLSFVSSVLTVVPRLNVSLLQFRHWVQK